MESAQKIIVESPSEDMALLNKLLKSASLQLVKKPSLHINLDEIISYLTVGGRFHGLVKCLLSYKIKHSTREVTMY
jgi:hypothetical protein